jgi:hypothetical protein
MQITFRQEDFPVGFIFVLHLFCALLLPRVSSFTVYTKFRNPQIRDHIDYFSLGFAMDLQLILGVLGSFSDRQSPAIWESMRIGVKKCSPIEFFLMVYVIFSNCFDRLWGIVSCSALLMLMMILNARRLLKALDFTGQMYSICESIIIEGYILLFSKLRIMISKLSLNRFSFGNLNSQ